MNENILNSMVNRLKPSKTLEMLSLANTIEDSGKSVIHMELGAPDIPSPKSVKDATIEAINSDFTSYTEVKGLLPFREKINNYFRKQFNCDHYNPNNNYIVTPGAKSGLFYALMTLLKEDDEVILPAPIWGSYADIVRFMGAKPVYIESHNREGDFQIDKINSSINAKTKLILVNFPTNPTSQVLPKNHYQDLAEIVSQKENLFLLSDEIYNELTYSGKMNSFASFKELKDKLILVSGFSKSHSMTGYRLGYTIAPEHLIKKFSALQGNGATCATSFVQKAGIVALEEREHISRVRKIYSERAKLVIDLIAEIPDTSLLAPQAAFYAFLRIKNIQDSFALDFLNSKHVAVTPGSAFGPEYDDYIRLSFATTEANIREGIKRLKEFVKEIRGN